MSREHSYSGRFMFLGGPSTGLIEKTHIEGNRTILPKLESSRLGRTAESQAVAN